MQFRAKQWEVGPWKWRLPAIYLSKRKGRKSSHQVASKATSVASTGVAGQNPGWRISGPLALLLIWLLAFSIRALYLWELSDQLPFATLITDSKVYHAWATQIASGNWIGDQVFYQSPLYPYTMACIYKIAGVEPMAIRWVQILLGSCACVMVARAGRSFFNERAGVIAGFLLAVYSPALFFDGLIQKSSLDLFLMSAVLITAGCFLERQNLMMLFALGVSLGLLMLNRENARLLFPVLAAWLLLYFHDQLMVRRLRWLAILVLGCTLVMLPVGVRNYYVGGEFLISTSQLGPNLYIGNHPVATGLYEPLVPGRGHTEHERLDAVRLAEQAMGRSLTAGEVSRYWTDQALEFVRQHPGQWLRLLGWKIYLTLHGQEMVDSEGIEVYARHSIVLRWLLWLNFGVLVPLGILGMWASRHDWKRVAVLQASAVILVFSVAIFFVFARYRYPLVPIFVLFAGLALSQIGQMAQDHKAGRFIGQWAPGLVIALALIVPMNWPMPQLRDDSIAYANYGRELLEAGNYQLAEESLQTAIALGPGLSGPAYNLARVYDMQGKFQEARQQYQAVLAIDPKHGMSLWMLGRLLVAEQKHDQADPLLMQAAQLLPDNAHVRSDLGENKLQLQNLSDAIEQFRQALRIDPTLVSAANNLTWLLSTAPIAFLRDGQEALQWAKQLEKIDDPYLLDTAAAAYAQCGMFDEAARLVERAQQLARSTGNTSLEKELAERAIQYSAHQAWPVKD